MYGITSPAILQSLVEFIAYAGACGEVKNPENMQGGDR